MPLKEAFMAAIAPLLRNTLSSSIAPKIISIISRDLKIPCSEDAAICAISIRQINSADITVSPHAAGIAFPGDNLNLHIIISAAMIGSSAGNTYNILLKPDYLDIFLQNIPLQTDKIKKKTVRPQKKTELVPHNNGLLSDCLFFNLELFQTVSGGTLLLQTR